jgi:hypothetical protein
MSDAPRANAEAARSKAAHSQPPATPRRPGWVNAGLLQPGVLIETLSGAGRVMSVHFTGEVDLPPLSVPGAMRVG